MATFSKLTDQVKEAVHKRTARTKTVDTFLIHHQAGTNDDSVIANMRLPKNQGRQVSANYTISNEGRLTGVVSEGWRAWTSGSPTDGGKGAGWDHRSITVEIENQTGAPDWKISAKAIETAARLLNDLRKRYTIKNILGHRDLYLRYGASYATYCPGPDTVSKIKKKADELLAAETSKLTKAQIKLVGEYLNAQKLGKTSSAAAKDGKQDKNYWWLVQTWGRKDGSYPAPTYVIDGIPGPQTVKVEKKLVGVAQKWKDAQTPPPPPPAPEPEKWTGVTARTLYTWETVDVFNPFEGKKIGEVEAGSSVLIASKATVDGVTYLRTDWSTRQGNDSGIREEDLHAEKEPPVPAPEPEPEVPVDPEPEPPVEPEPTPEDPEPPVTPEPGAPPVQETPPTAFGVVVTIILAAGSALVSVIWSLLGS